MTHNQIILVRRSWRKLDRISPILLGDVFYTKLFLDSPQLQKMFKSSKDEQAKKLVDMLHSIIINLERLGEFSDEIKAMAIRHVGYGVEPKHYNLVGNALVWTLKNALGKDWNQDLEEAWIACYTTLTEQMLAA
ncbi:globin family protein [Emticicia sediminis]